MPKLSWIIFTSIAIIPLAIFVDNEHKVPALLFQIGFLILWIVIFKYWRD